ncbi:MAG: hypothetical protein SNI51_00180 [Rikenellaceae bacterium]
MDITHLEKLISKLACEHNYTPLVASEATLEASIKRYPTAWIQLPKVLYVEGRGEGQICHSITVNFLDDYSAYSFDDKAKRLAKMEEDVISIMTQLSCAEGVVEVNEMTVTPRLLPTTRHGDIAQTLVAKVVSYF